MHTFSRTMGEMAFRQFVSLWPMNGATRHSRRGTSAFRSLRSMSLNSAAQPPEIGRRLKAGTDDPYPYPSARAVCTGRLYGCVRELCPHDPCTRPVQPVRVHGSCGQSTHTHPYTPVQAARTDGPYGRNAFFVQQPYKRAVHPTVLHSSIYLFIVDFLPNDVITELEPLELTSCLP